MIQMIVFENDTVCKINNHIYIYIHTHTHLLIYIYIYIYIYTHTHTPSSHRTYGLPCGIPITCQYSMNIMVILPRNVGPVTAQLWPTSGYHWGQREITLRNAKRVKRRSIELEKTKPEIERDNGLSGDDE